MSLFASLVGYTMAVPFLTATVFVATASAALGVRGPRDAAVRGLARAALLAFGVRVKVHGRRHRDAVSPCIFAANHVSILDPLVLFCALDRPVRGVELEDHFRWPLWGTITRAMGSVPISHRGATQALRTLDRVTALLREGTSIVILPEGHRTRDGRLHRFMRGPFRVALEARVDVVPLAMRGLYERKNVHSPRVTPGTVHVVFGPPVPHATFLPRDERAFRDRVFESIGALLEDRR